MHSEPSKAAMERLTFALDQQMEWQSDDDTPSSVQRDKGLVWLEGWFDLPAALAAAGYTITKEPTP